MISKTTTSGVRIKSRVRAGAGMVVTKVTDSNHNQAAKGLRVESRVKAGAKPSPTPVPS